MGLLEELPSERKSIAIRNIKVEQKIYDDLMYLKEQNLQIEDIIVLALKKLPVHKLVKEVKMKSEMDNKSKNNDKTVQKKIPKQHKTVP